MQLGCGKLLGWGQDGQAGGWGVGTYLHGGCCWPAAPGVEQLPLGGLGLSAGACQGLGAGPLWGWGPGPYLQGWSLPAHWAQTLGSGTCSGLWGQDGR